MIFSQPLCCYASNVFLPVSSSNSYLLNFITVIVLGVTGGVVLNFMPCVMPILSLKILSLVKGHTSRAALGLSILGIFCCFQTFAIIAIVLKKSGRSFGLGASFQYPEFIIFLSLALIFYISASMERINIDILHRLNNFLHKYNFKSEALGNFCNGILAVLFSTSCTAPYIGSAMMLALPADDLMIFAVFVSLSTGFSVPYILLIAYPRLLFYMPKNPTILKYTKAVLSMLLLLTLFWLLDILQLQLGLRPMLGLTGLLILLKFIIESESGIFKRFKVKLVAVSLVIIASFTLPKMTYDDSVKAQVITAEIWQAFEPDKISDSIKNGKIVVVDISADWCATCKYNKYVAWENPHVKSMLLKENIVALRGDYTGKDAVIEQYLHKNRAIGIPFSKIYGPKNPAGVELPVLLFPSDIIKAIKKVSDSL